MKITEKDAIWCKTQKQWDSIIEMLNIPNLKPEQFKHYGVESVIRFDGEVGHYLDRQYYKENRFTIHKAKDILKKSKIKQLEKRVYNLEKVNSDNTTVSIMESVKPGKELEELPEKWCIKTDRKEVVDYCNKNGKCPPYLIDETLIAYFPSIDGGTTYPTFEKGYTEITFDQFKKWVLKEEENPIALLEELLSEVTEEESEKIKDEMIKKPLSIREVQVKVTSQEEANECAEIAVSRGEQLWDDVDCLLLTEVSNYFRKFNAHDDFAMLQYSSNFKEISIEQYRELFGKKYISNKAEIWKKWQVVKGEDEIIKITKDSLPCTNIFEGVVIEKLTEYGCSVGIHSDGWEREYFKLCTEPITLQNK